MRRFLSKTFYASEPHQLIYKSLSLTVKPGNFAARFACFINVLLRYARKYWTYMTLVMPEITDLIWRWWCPKFLNLYEVGDAQMSTEQCWNVLTGENRISERALCQCHFAHTDFPGIGPVSPRRVKGHWWPSIARFSKQTAIISKFSIKGLAFVNWALTAPSD